MIKTIFLVFIIFETLFCSEMDSIELLLKEKSFNKVQWKALLHYNGSKNIQDYDFYFNQNFSLKNELIATVKSFYLSKNYFPNINNHPQCRFPARFLFIKNELQDVISEFPKIECPEFNTFLKKAPAEDIYLIYASENVTKPTSMMGHTFLKFTGRNDFNQTVEHAITFYTVIESQNPIVLLYQNSISGMQGRFALQPYYRMKKQYMEAENRNIWEYKLNLTSYDKKLIAYHMWELKDKKMKYFFTSYNCSTVIYYILSLANEQIYDDTTLWITPLETVKYLYKYHLISNSLLMAGNEWLIKMILENNVEIDSHEIKVVLKEKKYESIKKLNFNSLNLLMAYAKLEHSKNKIDLEDFNKLYHEIEKQPDWTEKSYDISKYKTPSKIPPEREITFGVTNLNNRQYASISFLPASHELNGDNKEYFGENELKLGYLSILINKDSIELDNFTLYSMKSYIPYDNLTRNFSYQLGIAAKKMYSSTLDFIDGYQIDGGFGADLLISHDLNLFFILNGGVAYNFKEKFYTLFNPTLGFLLYEILNMKSYVFLRPNIHNFTNAYNELHIEHNIYLKKNLTASFRLEYYNAKHDFYDSGFSIKYLF